MQHYLPKANTVEQYDSRKYLSIMDQILLLGFAITVAELKRDYFAKLVGTESIAGTRVARGPRRRPRGARRYCCPPGREDVHLVWGPVRRSEIQSRAWATPEARAVAAPR